MTRTEFEAHRAARTPWFLIWEAYTARMGEEWGQVLMRVAAPGYPQTRREQRADASQRGAGALGPPPPPVPAHAPLNEAPASLPATGRAQPPEPSPPKQVVPAPVPVPGTSRPRLTSPTKRVRPFDASAWQERWELAQVRVQLLAQLEELKRTLRTVETTLQGLPQVTGRPRKPDSAAAVIERILRREGRPLHYQDLRKAPPLQGGDIRRLPFRATGLFSYCGARHCVGRLKLLYSYAGCWSRWCPLPQPVVPCSWFFDNVA